MRHVFVAAFAALFCVLSFDLLERRSCTATQVVRLTLGEAASRADVVVEARVIEKRVRVGSRGRIETEYLVRVDRALRGALPAVATLRMPGGVLPDGRGMVIPGLPSFRVGDDVVWLLGREQVDGTRLPIGLAQGALRVAQDTQGERVLTRELGGLEYAGGARPASASSSIPYAAGLAEIETALTVRPGAR